MVKYSLLTGIKLGLSILVFVVGCTPSDIEKNNVSSNTITPFSVAPTKTRIPTATPIPEVLLGIVEVGSLNIRAGPGTSHPVIGSLHRGDEFYILGESVNSTNNKWLLISLSNSFGWVIGEAGYVTIKKTIVDFNTYLEWQRNKQSAKSFLVSATARPTIAAPLPNPFQATLPAVNNNDKNCSPAYPGVCIPPRPPDLDCKDIPYRRFTVLSPDPHGFDGDGDGIGCE